MIDEKKLIEEWNDISGAPLNGNRKVTIASVRAAIQAQPKVGKWISCSVRLPEIRKNCLVTVRYAGFMGMHGIWVKTGHMESENDWWGDCVGGEVIAWQPLPEPYKGQMIKEASKTYDDVCEWQYNEDEYYWESSCGHLHIFMADGPKENEYSYCPYCGKKIKVVEI